MHRRVAHALDRHPTLTVWLAAAVALVGCALFAAVAGLQRPWCHDEFSYLLAADTLAHGRLANPTHPLADHFETMHVIQRPTYVSRYQPAQPAALAFGQVVFGRPIIGVWLSAALMCAAVCWMLRAWMPPRWAFLGAVIAALGFGTSSYWAQSAWGGAIPALGGALLIGAVAHTLRRGPARAHAAHGAWAGVGIALLANTRMYEGGILTLLAAGVLLVWATRNRARWPALLRRVVLPAALVLAPVITFDAYFNYRTTGSPLRMPYAVYIQRYQTAPIFYWQHPSPDPGYPNPDLAEFHRVWEMSFYPQPPTLHNVLAKQARKVRNAIHFYGQALLWAPALLTALTLPWLWRNRRTRYAILGCLVMLAAATVTVFYIAHYSSPFIALLVLLAVQSLRITATWRTAAGRPVGRHVVTAALALGAIAWAADLLNQRRHRLVIPADAAADASLPAQWNAPPAKPEVSDYLRRHSPKPVLAIVRYAPGHNVNEEWVYNGADIDRQPIVWARSLGPTRDADLLRYYPDRTAWYFDVAAPGASPRLQRITPDAPAR